MPLYSPFGKVIGSIPRISGHIFQATAMAGLACTHDNGNGTILWHQTGKTVAREISELFFAAEQQVWISREPFDE